MVAKERCNGYKFNLSRNFNAIAPHPTAVGNALSTLRRGKSYCGAKGKEQGAESRGQSAWSKVRHCPPPSALYTSPFALRPSREIQMLSRFNSFTAWSQARAVRAM
jgi:hypothetical protein